MNRVKQIALVIAAVCAGATALTSFFTSGIIGSMFPSAIFWLIVGILADNEEG